MVQMSTTHHSSFDHYRISHRTISHRAAAAVCREFPMTISSFASTASPRNTSWRRHCITVCCWKWDTCDQNNENELVPRWCRCTGCQSLHNRTTWCRTLQNLQWCWLARWSQRPSYSSQIRMQYRAVKCHTDNYSVIKQSLKQSLNNISAETFRTHSRRFCLTVLTACRQTVDTALPA